MYKDVFVGLAHDEKFDFDVFKNDPAISNIPTIVIRKESPFMYSDPIYWDLVDNPCAKQLDWGAWGVKGTKQELCTFLTRYKNDGFAEYLQERINKLPDSIEYVLFAMESGD